MRVSLDRPHRSSVPRLYAVRSQNLPLDQLPEILRNAGIWSTSSFPKELRPTKLPLEKDISALGKHKREAALTDCPTQCDTQT